MAKAKQLSVLPTRKLATGSIVTAAFGTQLGPALTEVWPNIATPLLAGPQTTNLIVGIVTALAGVLVAYWVPDAPNQAVDQ